MEKHKEQIVFWISLTLQFVAIIFGVIGIVFAILTFINIDTNAKSAKHYSSSLLVVGIIFALFPLTRMLFKNINKYSKPQIIKDISSVGYKVAIKVHLYISLSSICLIIGHGVFWIYSISNGGYTELHHGSIRYKNANFDFPAIIGIIALSLLILVTISSITMKYTYKKPWFKKYRLFHIVLAITEAIIIIIHIAVV